MKKFTAICNGVLFVALLNGGLVKAEIPNFTEPTGYNPMVPSTWASNWRERCTYLRQKRSEDLAAAQQEGSSNAVRNIPIIGGVIGGMANDVESRARNRNREEAARLEPLIQECVRREKLVEKLAEEQQQPQQVQAPSAQPNRPTTYERLEQQREAEQAQQRNTMAGSYQACLQAAQYMSNIDRIRAAHVQSCQCLLQGHRGVVSPAGDFMGCDPRSSLPRSTFYSLGEIFQRAMN